MVCGPGDTVTIKEYTYQGAMNRLRTRDINIDGAKLDDGALDIGALAGQSDEMLARGVIPKLVYRIPTVQNLRSSVLSIERR